MERGGQQPAVPGGLGAAYHHALTTGFSRAYLVSAGIPALIAIIALTVIRVRRQDLSGEHPAPAPTGDATAPSRA